jgi:hypothetical protein
MVLILPSAPPLKTKRRRRDIPGASMPIMEIPFCPRNSVLFGLWEAKNVFILAIGVI